MTKSRFPLICDTAEQAFDFLRSEEEYNGPQVDDYGREFVISFRKGDLGVNLTYDLEHLIWCTLKHYKSTSSPFTLREINLDQVLDILGVNQSVSYRAHVEKEKRSFFEKVFRSSHNTKELEKENLLRITHLGENLQQYYSEAIDLLKTQGIAGTARL